MVERRPVKAMVPGSSPGRGAEQVGVKNRTMMGRGVGANPRESARVPEGSASGGGRPGGGSRVKR